MYFQEENNYISSYYLSAWGWDGQLLKQPRPPATPPRLDDVQTWGMVRGTDSRNIWGEGVMDKKEANGQG